MSAGVEDDGYPRGLSPQDLDTSLNTLKAMTESVNAVLQPLREMPASKGRSFLIVRVYRLCQDELSYTDLRIAGAFQFRHRTCVPAVAFSWRVIATAAAVAGSVDSGKSTLVAVLTHGQKGRPLLDDGHGSARMSVLKHKHEIVTGRTSSLSHHTLAYDRDAGVLNYAGVAPMMPLEIAAAATKVVPQLVKAITWCFLASEVFPGDFPRHRTLGMIKSSDPASSGAALCRLGRPPEVPEDCSVWNDKLAARLPPAVCLPAARADKGDTGALCNCSGSRTAAGSRADQGQFTAQKLPTLIRAKHRLPQSRA